jgi:hypothetical protein
MRVLSVSVFILGVFVTSEGGALASSDSQDTNWLVDTRVGLNRKLRQGKISRSDRERGWQLAVRAYSEKKISAPAEHSPAQRLSECFPQKNLPTREDGSVDVQACRATMEETCPPIKLLPNLPNDHIGAYVRSRVMELESRRRRWMDAEMNRVCGEIQTRRRSYASVPADAPPIEASGSGLGGF